MTQKKAALVAAVGIGAICLTWLIIIWANWMADNEEAEFERTCDALNSEAFFKGERWICIRDNEVVYP